MINNIENYYKNFTRSYASLWNVTHLGIITTAVTLITVANFLSEMWIQLNRVFIIVMIIWFLCNSIATIISFSKKIVFKNEALFTLLQTSLLSFLMIYLISLLVILNGVQSDHITIAISFIHVIGLSICIASSFVVSYIYTIKKMKGKINRSTHATKYKKISPVVIIPFVFAGMFIARTNQNIATIIGMFVAYVLAIIFPFAIKDYYFLTYLKFKSKDYWEDKDYTKIDSLKETAVKKIKNILLQRIKNIFKPTKYAKYGLFSLISFFIVSMCSFIFVKKLGFENLSLFFSIVWLMICISIIYFLYKHIKTCKESNQKGENIGR